MTAFEVVPIAIGRYHHHEPLDGVDRTVAEVVEAFTELGGAERPWAIPDGERTEAEIGARLRDWAGVAPRCSVVFWTGHGASDGDTAWLAGADTGSSIAHNGVNTATVADQLLREWSLRRGDDGAWALVVVEACGAGTFVRGLNAALASSHRMPERLVLLGVGTDDGASHLGEFSRALTETLAAYNDNDAVVHLHDLVHRLRDRMSAGRLLPLDLAGVTPLVRRRVLPGAMTVPVDVYRELREFLGTLDPDQRAHFIPKAQGAENGELSWYFVGRREEQRTILSWLAESESGMLVVTGRAGAGKSALLGNVLVHTNPGLRALLVRSGRWKPVSEDVPEVALDAVVHLTGLTAGQLVARLAEAAGLSAPETETDADWLVDALRDRRFTVFADALDEAQEPIAIASSVLRRIAELPGGRVVVGTRASTHEGPDRPDPHDHDLLDALGKRRVTVLVPRDPAAVFEYVRMRLAAVLSERAVEEIAARIRDYDREFLFARLAVHEIVARPELADDRAELEAVIGHDHRTLFAAAVDRLAAKLPSARKMLHALALARGRGLPRTDLIWPRVAGALTGTRVTEAEIDALLDAAAPYVMLDADDDQATYRLAHQTFVEHFRPWQDKAAHQRITRELLRMGGENGWRSANRYLLRRLPEHALLGKCVDFLLDDPGAMDHLDQRALGNAVVSASFGEATPPAMAKAITRTRHLLSETPVVERAAVRSIAIAAEGGNPDLAWSGEPWWPRWVRTRLNASHLTLAGHRGGVTGLLAVGSVLAVHTGNGGVRLWDPVTGDLLAEITAETHGEVVAFASHGEGLVIATADGHVVRCDSRTGQARGPVLRMSSIVVSSLAVLPGGLVAVGDVEGEIRVHRLRTGERIGSFRVGGEPLLASMRLPGGSSTLVAADADGRVWRWEPSATAPVEVAFGHDRSAHNGRFAGPSTALVVVPDTRFGDILAHRRQHDSVHFWMPGPTVERFSSLGARTDALAPMSGLLAVGDAELIRLWDPAKGPSDPLARRGAPTGREIRTGRAGRVEAVAGFTPRNGPIVLASTDGGPDGTVQVWRPESGTFGPAPSYDRGPVASLALLAGQLVATAHENGQARLWSLGNGEELATLATAPVDEVRALLAVSPDLLAIGQKERIVLREHGTGASRTLEARGAGLVSALTLVPGARPLLAAAGGVTGDGAIRLWDLETGAPQGKPLDANARGVDRIIGLPVPGGDPLLVFAGVTGAIQFWDPYRAGRIPAVDGQPLSAVTLPDGRSRLAVVDPNSALALWDPVGREFDPNRASGFEPTVLTRISLPGGRFALAGGGPSGAVTVWALENDGIGARLASIPVLSRVTALAAAPGPSLVVGTDAGLLVVDLRGL